MPKTTEEYEGYTDKVFVEKGGRNGVRTVGSGINVEEKHNKKLLPADVVAGIRPITKEENEAVKNKNKDIADKDARAWAGKSWDNLDDRAKEVIRDMHYNMGGPRMKKFQGLKKAAEKQDYNRMADEIQYSDADKKDKETPYYKQTKGRAKDHVKTLRSLSENKVKEDGIGMIAMFKAMKGL